jgi:threonylcarbamoyladenosine tRNA methylthiotransferase MtaB
MSGQLTDAVKSERSKILIAESRKRQQSFMQKLIGETVVVLTEETIRVNGRDYMTGFTKNYVRCALAGRLPDGEIVSGVVKGVLTDEILEVSGDS